MVNIDLNIITYAETYYSSLGYKKIDVPWIIDEDIKKITAPPGKEGIDFRSRKLNASAEQSYLQLIKEKKIEPGKYVATTPCFRDEDQEDELHQFYFLKTELINFNLNDDTNLENKLQQTIKDALEFFEQYLPVKVAKTKIGYDIIDKKLEIELGSYGIRKHRFQSKNEVSWVYGTGVALPRLTQVLGLTKKVGYHETAIPKAKAGSFFKILEEVEESKDAFINNNPIMLLQELADLMGAMECYLDQEFQGKIGLEDLNTMRKVTKRAFLNGRR